MNRAVPSIWTGDRDLVAVSIGLAQLRANLRRNARRLLIWIVVCNLIGLAYTRIVRPEFVATAQVLLQARHFANDGPEDLRHFHQFAIDSQLCETELRVVRSERLLAGVFAKLGLESSPEMAGGADGFWAGLSRTLHRWAPGILPFDEELRAYYTFADRVRSRRIGLSYVIDISYRAHSAERAASVANAVASAYVASRLQQAYAKAEARNPYLKRSLDALAGQVATAESALRQGKVSETELPAADVSVLGPAAIPLRASYPKVVPTLIWTTGFAMASGLVVLLFCLRSLRTGKFAHPRDPRFATFSPTAHGSDNAALAAT